MVAQKTNEFIIHKDYAEMILESNTYGNLICYIDLEDIDKIKPYRWCPYKSRYSDTFYVQSTGRKNFSRIPLHRFITNCPKGKEVDHINHNGLDNRKSNLRVCTRTENMQNKLMYKNNKSGYRNINWNKSNKVWVVQVKRNGINTVVGTTTNLDKAVSMRDKYLKQILEIQEVE